jgi:hypothetical protein
MNVCTRASTTGRRRRSTWGREIQDRSRDGRERRKARDGRAWRKARDGRAWRKARDGRAWRKARDGREWRKARDGREWRKARDGREWRKARDGRERRKARDRRERRKARDGRERPRRVFFPSLSKDILGKVGTVSRVRFAAQKPRALDTAPTFPQNLLRRKRREGVANRQPVPHANWAPCPNSNRRPRRH